MMGSKVKRCTVVLVARQRVDMERTANDGADSWYGQKTFVEQGKGTYLDLPPRGSALHYHFIDGIRV